MQYVLNLEHLSTQKLSYNLQESETPLTCPKNDIQTFFQKMIKQIVQITFVANT